MLCVVCLKKADLTFSGYTFCKLHYLRSRKYPDPADIHSYVKSEEKKRKK